MKYLIPFLFALTLLIPTRSIAAPSHSKIPTFSIQSVSKDSTVTIVTRNFPANDSFKVLMGEMGTRGVGGYVVATQKSGSGGAFTATYDIPDDLKGNYRIAIRLDSPTSGYFAYNWFYNNTTSGKSGNSGTGGVSPTKLAPGTIPTFYIKSVVRNDTVTIRTNNFPADDSFTVRMGYMWTRGVGGYVVDTQDSGDGGTFSATYDIPAKLKGQYRIAIRLESSSSGYFAYNWFYNNTATVP